MAALADITARPDALKQRTRGAFNRFWRDLEAHPRAATVYAVVDLQGKTAFIDFHGGGIEWQHQYALAAALLQRLKYAPELMVGSEPINARLDAAIEALDVPNVYLVTAARE